MEANNMKAMREALEQILALARARGLFEIQSLSETALAAPPRNCDVGTAAEQVERFKEYCQSNMQYYWDMFGTHEGADGWDCKEDCPVGKMIDKNDSFCDHCELLWAQMPYEEGGEK